MSVAGVVGGELGTANGWSVAPSSRRHSPPKLGNWDSVMVSWLVG